jgi:hypothetical protein
MTILDVESARHREMLRQPFTQMPFPYHCRLIANLVQGIGERPFGRIKPVNAACWRAICQHAQGNVEQREIVWLSKVLTPPVHPLPKWITTGQQRRPCRRTNRRHVKLGQAGSLPCQKVDGGCQSCITTMKTGISPTEVISQNEHDIGPHHLCSRGVETAPGHKCPHAPQHTPLKDHVRPRPWGATVVWHSRLSSVHVGVGG